jgi:4-amino-4-deoxy-L-arabinose transferase-like glycosyltransferase
MTDSIVPNRLHTPPKTPYSPPRLLAFLIAAVVVGALLVTLQDREANAGTWAFLLVIAVGAGVVIAPYIPPLLRRVYAAVRQPIMWFVQHVMQIRRLLAVGAAGAAVTLMAMSAFGFQHAYFNGLPMIDPALLALSGAVAMGAAVMLSHPNVALPLMARTRSAVATAQINLWLTGAGIGVMLYLSEMNGRALNAQRLYIISYHTQFWLLVVGLTCTVLGLCGWRFAMRAPAVRSRVIAAGALLYIASVILSLVVEILPLIPAARVIADTILFWTARAGNGLVLWGIIGHRWKLPYFNFRRRWVIAVLVVPAGLLAQAEVRALLGIAAQSLWLWLVVTVVLVAGLWYGRKRTWPRTVIAGVVLMVVLASIRQDFAIEIGRQMALNTAFWGGVWLYIVLCCMWSIVRDRLNVDGLRGVRRGFTRPRLLHYGALAVIIILAFGARFYLLNDSMRFLVDEDSFLGATHFLRVVPNMELLAPFSSIAAFPYLYPYWQMLAMDLFGRDFTGLRATSAIIGALTVPGVYLLARTVFDRRTALVAGGLMATYPVHLQFSRIGISEVGAPLFGVFALALLGRGMLHGRRRDFVLGGALLGMTHYFHEGGRMVFTPLAIGWIVLSLLLTRRAKNQTSDPAKRSALYRNLLAALAALVIAAAPIYYTLIATNRPLFARMTYNDAGLAGSYWEELQVPENMEDHIRWHVLPPFQVYVFQVDSTMFYGGNTGLILPFVVPAFLLGAAYALWRWRAMGTLLLLMWVLGTSVGNTLLVDSAGSPRYAMVFPALMMVVAVGIRYTIPLIIRNGRWQTWAIALVGIGLALAQVNYYFSQHLPMYNREFRAMNATPDGYDAALRSLEFPVGTNIHIIAPGPVNQIEAIGLIGLYRGDVYLDTITPDEVTEAYIDDLSCRVDHAFFVEAGDFGTLSILRKHFFLRPAEFSSNPDMLPEQRLLLFYAPYIRGSEAIFGDRCSSSPIYSQ